MTNLGGTICVSAVLLCASLGCQPTCRERNTADIVDYDAEDRYLEGAQQTLAHLKSTDPRKEARAAIERKDFRFLAMYEGVPGVTKRELDTYVHAYGTRIVRYTNDAALCDEHVEILKIVGSYASTYNQELLSFLQHAPVPKEGRKESRKREMWPDLR
jgi:hypothetical protein